MYLRSMKILQDELQNPKARAEFEAQLEPLFDQEVDDYRREFNKSYLNQHDVNTISRRVVKKYTDSIIKGKF